MRKHALVFQPEGRKIEVDSELNLSQAASDAGVYITAGKVRIIIN
jgi:hypothetical protein